VFTGKTVIDLCIQHATAAPTPPSAHVAIAPELEAIILRCLEKQPAERFPDARTLGRALAALAPDAWSEAAAARWWVDFRPRETMTSTSTSAPEQITVDLENRSAA
jgi:serine/threonine-protein kinase